MELTIYDGIKDPIEAAIKLGEQFAKSGMFGCTKTEQGTVLALACFCEKKNPFEIKKRYHIIEGNLTMRADAMLAEFKRRHAWTWMESTPKRAAATITVDEQIIFVEYTWDDVVLAELHKRPNYIKYPKQMLRSRLISETVRMYDPEIVSGSYTPEEVSDFTEKPAQARVVETWVPPALKRLEAICEPYEDEINQLLRENGHINPDQNFRDLPGDARAKIIDTPNHPLIESAIALRKSKEGASSGS